MNTPRIDLIGAYQAQVQSGALKPDAAQAMAVTRLHNLANALLSDAPNPPHGVYLYGPVGRGKSQVMELFFNALPIPNKRRVHMHAFMGELHKRVHAAEPAPGHDLMLHIAQQIAAEAAVLCFDEFYITNIADAMLLGRLMQKLFDCGVVVVATSNWPMDGLFQGGLNRDRFMPFIRLLQKHMQPVDVSGGPDYRMAHAGAWPLYVVPQPSMPAEPQLQVLFDEFARGQTVTLSEDLTAKRVKGRAAWFHFSKLCEVALGREHYIELARRCDTVVLEGVPTFTASESDSALRFVTLVDIMYEHRRRLVISAAAYPGHLCPKGEAADAFRRTASRLAHMQAWGNAMPQPVVQDMTSAMAQKPKAKPVARKAVAKPKRKSHTHR